MRRGRSPRRHLRCYLRAGPLATPCPERRAALRRRARGECPPGSGGQALSTTDVLGGAALGWYRHRLARGKGASDGSRDRAEPPPAGHAVARRGCCSTSAPSSGCAGSRPPRGQFGVARPGTVVAARHGGLLSTVGDRRARARRYRPRGGRDLSMGRRAFGPLHGFVGRVGVLGQQPVLLPVAPRHDGGHRGVRRRPALCAPGRGQRVHRAGVARGTVARGGHERRGLAAWESGCRIWAATGTWLPGLVFVVLAIWSLTDARQRDAIHCTRPLAASLDLQSINLFAHYDIRLRRARAGAHAARRDPTTPRAPCAAASPSRGSRLW